MLSGHDSLIAQDKIYPWAEDARQINKEFLLEFYLTVTAGRV
jgi:hypothetical protein